jgi:F-type H+-transporting ATPase subunit b
MPQLQQLLLVYQSQWLWLAIVLGVIFFVVGRGIVPRVEATVDSRNAKIAADLEAAERARQSAADAEDKWRGEIAAVHAEAHASAAKARSEAAIEAERRIAEADAALASRADEANARLAEARNAALAAIGDVAAEAARDIVTKVSGAAVSDAEARSAVKAAMAHG